MGMFLNYENIADYHPNNLKCSFPVGKSYTKLDPIQASKPYEEYNTKGELVGYFWRYGETLNLEFNIDGEITVESDAMIFVEAGTGPDISTVGFEEQRAYNIKDMTSWTCTMIVGDNYIWEMDTEFVYDEHAGTAVYVSAEDFLADKHVEVKLYNFRMEPIYTKIYDGTSKIILPITADLSKQMKRGIYYCSLTVFNGDVNLKIFDSHDCILNVK